MTAMGGKRTLSVDATHANEGPMLTDVLFLVLGVAMLLRGDVFARGAARRHEKRLSELRAGREERFFEERRSLEAYPPFAKSGTWRILGALLTVVTLGSML
jgi:hypothetical protein